MGKVSLPIFTHFKTLGLNNIMLNVLRLLHVYNHSGCAQSLFRAPGLEYLYIIFT